MPISIPGKPLASTWILLPEMCSGLSFQAKKVRALIRFTSFISALLEEQSLSEAACSLMSESIVSHFF
jgi:hypothetical protein